MQRILALLFALLFLAACGDDADPQDTPTDSGTDVASGVDAGGDLGGDAAVDMGPPALASVMEPGEFKVGYRTWRFNYDALEEPDRELRLVVWYPSTDTEGFGARYAGLLNRPEVLKDISVAIDEPAPVLVFSHGNSSMAEQSYYMTEFFASHGWIVFAIDHTGNTFRQAQGGITLDSAGVRPTDISALLDEIERVNADDADPLAGLLSDDVMLSGHSFGGYTTLAVTGAQYEVDALLNQCDAGTIDPTLCEIFTDAQLDAFRAGFLDERIKAAIPQTPAGSLIFQTGLAEISIPTLLMTSENDRTLTNATEGDPIWRAMRGDHVRLNLLRGGHFTYSNMCEIFGPFIENVANDGCNEEFIEATLSYQIINAYSLAWGRRHFMGDTSNDALLDGSDNPWPEEVEIEVK